MLATISDHIDSTHHTLDRECQTLMPSPTDTAQALMAVAHRRVMHHIGCPASSHRTPCSRVRCRHAVKSISFAQSTARPAPASTNCATACPQRGTHAWRAARLMTAAPQSNVRCALGGYAAVLDAHDSPVLAEDGLSL